MTYCNEKQMPCEWAQIGGGCSVSACLKVLFTAGGWPMPTKPPEFVKPPMTNADRIRAMSDKELAHWISLNSCEDFTYEHCCTAEWRKKPCNNKCVACLVAWLQQPAEEGD